MSSELILVTGASGYIATHIVQQLQQQGHRVRGTVRSLKNEEKVKPLKELCPDAKYPLELVEADLLDGDSWVKAVKDCKYVIHVASPFPIRTPKNENDVIVPAVEGTLNVLKACTEITTVKRVVLTSSTVAITLGSSDPEKISTEEDWIDVNSKQAPVYHRSKALAETAAWDFLQQVEDGKRFELAVVNPGFVLGPVLNDTIGVSMTLSKDMLEGRIPVVPYFQLPIADVRDVAAAHIKAMEVPEAAGNRHIIYSESIWLTEIAEILADEFNPQGYNVRTTRAPYWLLWLVSWFDRSAAEILPIIGKYVNLDNKKITSALGIQPRNVKDTIIDMCYSMIERGIIKKSHGYNGPKTSK